MHLPTVTTKLVCLLGNPLGHSVSPQMHNRVFEKLEMDYCYMPVEVASENLETVFNGLCKMSVSGFNVTIPHKVQIVDYLDQLDPVAAAIGAVNTICIRDNKTFGYNTDGEGFLRSLEEGTGITAEGKSFFIVGCGGAARAIAMTLAFKQATKIFICNRSPEKAYKLVDEINSSIRPCAEAVEQDPSLQKQRLKDCNCLINTTSLGMHPKRNTTPINEELLFQELIVADIVYNPLKTKLLTQAAQKGCQTVSGLGMFIYQGAAAFKLWTGKDPLIAEMRDEVLSTLTNF